MPISEGLVFSSSKPYGKSHEEILPFIRYGGGVTVASPIVGYAQLREKAIDKKNGSDEIKYLSKAYMSAGGYPGLGFSYGDGTRLAVGLTPGYVVVGTHIDATVRTVEKVFFTVNHNLFFNGTELILQRPVLEKRGGGLSVGAFYRNQEMQFTAENEEWSYNGSGFRIKWYGLRLMGQQPSILHNSLKARGYINVGYVHSYNALLVSAGLAIAID
ncbi:MAG: hypothetical protein WD016_11770 [Balneolaceae bacterium]